jgi:hypothetical protein
MNGEDSFSSENFQGRQILGERIHHFFSTPVSMS